MDCRACTWNKHLTKRSTEGLLSDCRLVLLPGLDGTGRLFVPLRRQLAQSYEIDVVSYPSEVERSYDELALEVAKSLPTKSPFVLVAELFLVRSR